MSQDARASRVRRLIVANRGSDSDDSDDNPYRRYRDNVHPNSQPTYTYHPPPLPSPSIPTHHATPAPSYTPTPLTRNLLYHTPNYQPSNPPLSSPSSTSSPAAESTPPPSTPGLSAPPIDFPGDGPSSQDPAIAPYTNDDPQISSSRTAKILQTPKSPFHSGPPPQPRPPTEFPKRPSTSPTVSTPDSYTSNSSHGSGTTVSDKVLVVVTADSERYLTVDISGAKDPAFIRERIFTKLCVWDEEDQSQFSIYQTEIGAFAIGDALTDELLFELCREQGDSRGSLKFFVSHSSAPVHEQPSRSSSSLSPSVNTIPPPVLPSYNTNSYAPLRPKRRSKSKQGSPSSASEQLPLEVAAAGYEADLDNADRDTNRPTVRPPPQPVVVPLSGPSNPPPSPHAARRPSGPLTRPISPFSHSSRPNSPPPLPPDRTRQATDAPPLIDKYGHIVPTPPPPPPLSPNRSTFAMHDDNNLTPPAMRALHVRSGSDTTNEREQASQASKQRVESSGRSWRSRREPRHRGKHQPQSEVEDGIDQSESWVVIPRDGRVNDQPQPSTPQDGARNSPSLARGGRSQFSPVRFKPTSPYSPRPLAIPNTPRNPAPSVPAASGEPRIPLPVRPAGQPVPANWTVMWKGAEKGDQKLMPSSSAQWSRLTKGTKSMDNLRAAAFNGHPPTLQPGGTRRGTGQLPMAPPNGSSGMRDPIPFSSSTYIREPGGSSSSGVPKSYDVPRSLGRPLPIQGSSHSSSLDISHSSQNQYSVRGPGLMSPSHDPYPRPQSAFGDQLPSPAHRYQRHMQSPGHGSSLETTQDTIRSPRGVSPSRQLKPTGLGIRPTNYGDRSSDGHSGVESSRTPPRSPASPRSPRHIARERQGGVSEALSSSVTENTLHGNLEDNRDSEGTLRQEDRAWLTQLIDGSDDGTLIASWRTDTDKPPRTNRLSESSESSPLTPYSQSSGPYEDSDSDRDDGGTWKKPLMAETPRPKSILRGPALKVQIENSTGVRTVMVPSTGVHSLHATFAQPTPTPPPSHRPTSPSPLTQNTATPKYGKAGARVSTFTDVRDDAWPPRPPPEDVYERLEDFFPEHDLDKPVIEASSGGTSPTTAEYAAVPAPPVVTLDKSRVKGKKSIRIVAEEHKKRIDRTSRADSSAYASVLRKRSTKLWGSKLEEVTTVQAKASLGSSLPESPSGGPTTFKWVRGELIGRGTYGRVYLALNATTGEMIAVKQVEIPRTASDKNDSRQVTVVQALKLESETLKHLDHPNIVQYLGFEETPDNLSIFLEYVPGGSIGSCLLKHGKFDEEVTKSFTAQIISGLEYLHSKGILHRDLKADNILVEMSGICKISDFGISKRTDDSSGGAHTAMQGTVFWMAPEVINAQKKGYNFKIDIWSVGCVVLEMWAGMRPWIGDEAVAVMFKLYQAKLPPPVPEDVTLSPLADDFRRKCFAINPEERPTAAELRKHPYLVLPQGWVFNSFK